MLGIFNPLFVEDKVVVLVIHSYAGVPGSAAIKGLSKVERASNGSPGGIIGVTYQSAFIPSEAVAVLDLLGGQLAPWQTEEVHIDIPQPDGQALDEREQFH
jgi:hypothetical protein